MLANTHPHRHTQKHEDFISLSDDPKVSKLLTTAASQIPQQLCHRCSRNSSNQCWPTPRPFPLPLPLDRSLVRIHTHTRSDAGSHRSRRVCPSQIRRRSVWRVDGGCSCSGLAALATGRLRQPECGWPAGWWSRWHRAGRRSCSDSAEAGGAVAGIIGAIERLLISRLL